MEQEPKTDRIEYGTDGNAYKLWISNGKEYEPSGDLISRQAVLDIDFHRIMHTTAKPSEMIRQEIINLPSVNPQEKTGHWITKQNEVFKYYCDKCGTGDNLRTNYCPNCGCRMIAPHEERDKE